MQPFAVVYRRAGQGFTAHVPELPGCHAFGFTLAEAERNVNAAIQSHLGLCRCEAAPAPRECAGCRDLPLETFRSDAPVLPLLAACGSSRY